MKHLVIYILSICMLALFSALYDNWKMEQNKKKGINNDLNHTTRWSFRFLVSASLAYFLGMFVFFFFSWALFNLVFRPILNALNNKDPRYIAPWGNDYDLFGFTFSVGHDIPEKLWDLYVEKGSQIYHTKGDTYVPKDPANPWINVEHYRRLVHKGGAILYSIEGSLFIIGVIAQVMYLCCS